MSFSLAGDYIEQTGTDADLSGMTAAAGTAIGGQLYDTGGYRLRVNGTLTIASQTLRADWLHVSGGTLTIGADDGNPVSGGTIYLTENTGGFGPGTAIITGYSSGSLSLKNVAVMMSGTGFGNYVGDYGSNSWSLTAKNVNFIATGERGWNYLPVGANLENVMWRNCEAVFFNGVPGTASGLSVVDTNWGFGIDAPHPGITVPLSGSVMTRAMIQKPNNVLQLVDCVVSEWVGCRESEDLSSRFEFIRNIGAAAIGPTASGVRLSIFDASGNQLAFDDADSGGVVDALPITWGAISTGTIGSNGNSNVLTNKATVDIINNNTGNLHIAGAYKLPLLAVFSSYGSVPSLVADIVVDVSSTEVLRPLTLSPFMATDSFVTQSNMTTVNAYTSLADLSQLYDRAKAWFIANLAVGWPSLGVQAVTGDGTALDLGGKNLVLDPAAGSVYSVVTGTNTITAKTGSALAPTSKFTTIRNFGSLTLASGVIVSARIEADSDVVVSADIDQLTGTVVLTGTSRLDLSAPGIAPSGSSASGTTVRVTSASSGAVFDFRAWTFASGSSFENTSGQPIVLKLDPADTVPTLVQTSGAITVDNVATIEVSAPNLLNGSRIRLYNVTADEELDNAVVSGGSGYTISLASGTDYTFGDQLVLLATYHNAGTSKQVWRGSAAAGSDDITFSDSQVNWAEPNTLGIDGSGIAECSTDFDEVQVEVVDADNSTTKSRIAAFMVYALTTADGIREWVSLAGVPVIRFPTAATCVVDASVASVSVVNTKPTSKLMVIDEFSFTWSDGVNRADAVVGSSIIWSNALAVLIAETGVSGLTTEESAKLNFLDAAISSVPAAVRDVSNASPAAGSLGASAKLAQELAEADRVFVKATNTLHVYRRGTTVDLVPPKTVTGTSQGVDASITQ